MAEFCLECWNKLNDTNDTEENYKISKDLYLCEGCGEYKHVIISEKESLDNILWLGLLPIKLIGLILYILWRLLILPYTIYTVVIRKKKKG